jgi:predicted DNA-binding transcriptional regulator AlpA
MMTNDLPELLDVNAAAALLGCGRRTLYNLRNEHPGFPQPIQLREMVRYRRADLLRYIATLKPIDKPSEPVQLRAAAVRAGKHKPAKPRR